MSSYTSLFLFPADIQRAYKSGLYSDLKIICDKNEFLVHKIIVCSQSKVFQATCSNGFRESSTNTIDLTADGISLVSRMIHCFYHGTYAEFNATDDGHNATDDGHNWKSAHQLHAAMYAMGDKYDVTLLKDTALFNFNKLTTKASLQGFIESIPIVYSSTPDSDRALRNATREKITANPSQFLHEDVKASYQKVLFEVPEFSWDLHQYWMTVAPEPTVSAKKRR